jgi:hypothetical protein
MTNEEKKIPDNVVPHPNALPYASDLAAPVIKPDHISLFAPNERIGGYDNYVGTFRLNYDNRWEKIK